MASRRPSSRPSSRRRSSTSEAARTTREINAEKSRQRRAAAKAAQSSKGDEASARRARTGKKADAGKAEAGAERKASAKERRAQRARERQGARGGREGASISTRLVVVLTVAAILAVMLVPSVYQWWQQERELAQIKAQVAEQQRHNEEMQRQLDLWNDPDYISTQARERLGYVRPGETQYTVVDPGPQYQDSAMAAAAAPTGPARPWVQQLAILVGKADQPPSATPIPSADTSQSGQAPTTGQESGE